MSLRTLCVVFLVDGTTDLFATVGNYVGELVQLPQFQPFLTPQGTPTSTPVGSGPTSLSVSSSVDEWAQRFHSKYVMVPRTSGTTPTTPVTTSTSVTTPTTTEVNAVFDNAGVPVPDPPRSSPSLTNLQSSFSNYLAHPNDPYAAKNFLNLALATALGADCNVWALVMLVLRNAVGEENESLRYSLSKIDMYSVMRRNMGEYAKYLAGKQQELQAKIAAAPDKKKDKQEVVVSDLRFYGEQSFYTLDANGNTTYEQTGEGPGYVPVEPSDLIYEPSQNETRTTRGGTQITKRAYRDPHTGKIYKTDKRKESDQRADVCKQINGEHTKNTTFNAQGLSDRVQQLTQQMEALDKLRDKWQNRFQSQTEAKNTLVTELTTILKQVADMIAAMQRNMLA